MALFQPIAPELDATARQVASVSRAGHQDVALTDSRTSPGRLTFVWKDGDLVFDDTGAYGVLTSIFARKGTYRSDRTLGTLLTRVTRERSTTGSQLANYARDGGAAAEVAGIARNVRAIATKVRPGSWRLRITWDPVRGQAQAREIAI